MEFRISLYLHLFFTDHRSCVRLFISNKYKNVCDLENYISKTFNISKSFYLVSNGALLPKLEDVRILKEGDIVIAFPDTNNLNNIIPLNYNHTEAVADPEELEGYVTKRKRKKHSKNLEEISLTALEKLEKKKKKLKKSKKRDVDLDANSVDFDEDELPEVNGLFAFSKDTKPNLENRKFTFHKPMNLLPISEKPKIIQSIRVVNDVDKKSQSLEKKENNNEKQLGDCSSQLMECESISEETDKENELEEAQKEINLSEITINCKENSSSNTKQIENREKTESEEQTENSQSEAADCDTSENTKESLLKENKPKRKRVRSRKKKQVQEAEFVPAVVPIKPINTKAAPSLHIRFDDENAEEKKNNIANTNSKVNYTSTETKDDNVISIIPDINYDKLYNEEILNYPVMKDKFPKIGDVLAFKIFKLSDKYTPEISDFMIGKVTNFNEENDLVSINVLEGHEECIMPQGKFFIEDENNLTADHQEFSWKDLLEPRLLFP